MMWLGPAPPPHQVSRREERRRRRQAAVKGERLAKTDGGRPGAVAGVSLLGASTHSGVIPAKAGTHRRRRTAVSSMGPRFRGDDTGGWRRSCGDDSVVKGGASPSPLFVDRAKLLPDVFDGGDVAVGG